MSLQQLLLALFTLFYVLWSLFFFIQGCVISPSCQGVPVTAVAKKGLFLDKEALARVIRIKRITVSIVPYFFFIHSIILDTFMYTP